ncbi:transcription factor E2F8 isoform 1-T2 [Mantella aurantiaca]
MADAQKENSMLHLNRRMACTPSKQPTSALSELQCTAAALKTPTKPPESNNSDPWTPTANLKMLISAASPEIRNREREMLEEHFSGDDLEKTLPSRKEKSLGLLCHKFLARYPDYPNPAVSNSICLDEVAGELSVERRRIYDIVNVLESLHMVSRLAKNKYIWHGRHNLRKTFEALRQAGEESKYNEQILQLRKREEAESLDEEPITKSLLKQNDISFVELPGLEFRAASVNSRKEKSLRVMSQRFVMLFLVSRPQIVSLEIAAKILIGEDQIEDLDKSKFKTKIRRLYDIANVLSSLGLIKKVHVTEERGRKPAFQWTGPDACTEEQPGSSPGHTFPGSVALDLRSPKENCAKNLFSSRGKQSFTRHQSLIKLARSIENDRRKINSAPSSPTKSDSSDLSIPSKMAQLAAICKEQLDQTKEVKKMKVKMSRGGNAKVVAKSQNAPLQPASPLIYQALPLVQPHANSPTSYAVYLQQPAAIQGHAAAIPAQTPDAAHGEKSALEDDRRRAVSGGPAENDSPHDKCSRKFPEPDSSSSKRIKGSGPEDLAERLIPSGYLIPLHLTPISSEPGRDPNTSCTDHKIFTSPVTGLFPVKFMLSPGSVTSLPVVSQAGPAVTSSGSPSPSPGMMNFTLHNKDLISPPCGSSHPISISPRNRKQAEELQAAQMFRHLSPVPYHGQPFTLFALPQAGVPLTPKGSQPLKDNFFRTPGGVSSSPIPSANPKEGSQGPVYVSQRKLDVGGDD